MSLNLSNSGLNLSNSEIGLSHTLPKPIRFVPEQTVGHERVRSRFRENGSFYTDHKPSGSDSAGISTTIQHNKHFFGEPPVTSFDDTRTRTWAGHKVDRNFGMISRTSEFLKQVYSQERKRREHCEDQAKLLRKFRKKHISRNEMMRRKPLRNKRAIADQKKRRAFYDRSRLKTAPPSAHGRRHLRMIGENIHEKFTWQKAFSPVSQDLVSQGPELNQEQRMRKPNPRRGRAVGYWNKKFLNLNLRSPNYTACGNIE